MMTPGQYSRLSTTSSSDSKAGYGDHLSYSDIFRNESVYEYDSGMMAANGSFPSSSFYHHPQHLNSYEYEKPQRRPHHPNPSLRQYRHHRHNHKHRRRKNSKGEDIQNSNNNSSADDDDDDDDYDDDDNDNKYKCSVWSALLCGLGVVVAVVLIILLCKYVERSNKVDKEEKENLELSLTYLDVKNDIYFHRIARTILSAQQKAEQDSMHKELGYRRKELTSCNPLPETIREYFIPFFE